jgi:hypothetical protein
MMPRQYKATIEQAMALLDRTTPGWEQRFNYNRVDYLQPGRSIPELVFGSWREASEALQFDAQEFIKYGLVLNTRYRQYLLPYSRAWRTMLAARRHGVEPCWDVQESET